MSRPTRQLCRLLFRSRIRPPALPPLPPTRSHCFSTAAVSTLSPPPVAPAPASSLLEDDQPFVHHPHLDLMELPPSNLPDWPVDEPLLVTSESGSTYQLVRHSLNNYSCNCPAWKFQNKGKSAEVRTCKHLRQVLGEDHETARTGEPGKKPAKARKKATPKVKKEMPDEDGDEDFAAPAPKKKAAPRKKKAVEEDNTPSEVSNNFVPLLLATKYELGGKKDPKGMWVSEKLDGVRAYWDGVNTLWSRMGKPFSPPQSFIAKLPLGYSLDGELYLGRDRFDETSGVVRTTNSTAESERKWGQMKYMVFDMPSLGHQPFESRLNQLNTLFPDGSPGPVEVVKHEVCQGVEDLNAKLTEIQRVGGEGLMLRVPKSKYVGKRDKSLQKVKTFYDAEAKVIGYEPGKGKYEKVVGSLICEMESGQQFSVGSGMSDERRAAPPKLGAIISYRFQELTKSNTPRFPTFVGERADMDRAKDCVVRNRSANTSTLDDYSYEAYG